MKGIRYSVIGIYLVIGLRFSVIGATDTLKYDDGIAEGFYIVGDYMNDKLGVKFLPPYSHYRVRGMLVFADGSEGFSGASLYPGDNLPDTANPLIELDSVYSAKKEWNFTPIELEVVDPTPIWVILRVAVYPGVGGDINNPSGNSWYYSDSCGWGQATCNWLIRLILQEVPGYYEDFANSSAGYTGDWEFGVPSLTPLPKDNCFGTRLDTLYPDNTYLQLESPWIFVADYGLSEPLLIFKHFYDTQFEYDGGNVKISKDAINWQLIPPLRGYDVNSLSGAVGVDGEPGFSGGSDGWRKDYFFVPIWDSLKIRWCFGSDIAGTDYGWFIDEVKIGERPPHDVLPRATNFRKIMPPETTITPSAEIKNLGIYTEGIFSVKCRIESCGVYIYEDIQPLPSIEPDSTITVNFSSWSTANEGVFYNVKIYTDMTGDEYRANDTIRTKVLTFLLIDSITAGFTDLVPTIDGIIDSIEWKDATVVDGSDVLGIDSIDPCGSCKLYFMNSNSFIYIGAKANSIKEFKVYIDETGDGGWNTDGSEGFYRITQDEYKFQDMYYHIVYSLPESLKSISSQGVEIGIPIGMYEPQEIIPTESLRCFIQANTPTEYIGWWPQYISSGNYNNPTHYAKIKIIGAGVEENSKHDHDSRPRFTIYPNPFSKKTVIRVLGSCLSLHDPPARITIYDLVGRLVKSWNLEFGNLGFYEVVWDATNLSAGFYFVVYKAESTKIIKKLTVIH